MSAHEAEDYRVTGRLATSESGGALR
jgi:hypothetical protein